MTTFSIAEIAKQLGAKAVGDVTIRVASVQEPAKAEADQLALAMEPSYAEPLAASNAQAAVVWEGADWESMGLKAAVFAPRLLIPRRLFRSRPPRRRVRATRETP